MKKLYAKVCEKNQTFDSAIQDFKNSHIKAEKIGTAILTELNNLKVEHEGTNHYLVEITYVAC